MPPVICRCGSVDNYRTEKKSNNLVAYCNVCDAYIKNIPHADPTLYVGKYKGTPIKDIDDLSYLEWAIKTLTLSNPQKEAIQSTISRLEFLAK